jgi:hypothetical protein
MAYWFSSDALRGQPLRYLVSLHLIDAGSPQTVRQLVAAIEAKGYVIGGRASKTMSDTLRTEVRRGRVIRVSRGRYAAGRTPRSTVWWMRKRISELVDFPLHGPMQVVAKTLAQQDLHDAMPQEERRSYR